MSFREEIRKLEDRLGELLQFAETDTNKDYEYSNTTYYLKGAKDYIDDVAQYLDGRTQKILERRKREKEQDDLS